MRTILVVEDNTYNMKLVRSLLQIGGFKVVEAWTAEEGLELIKKHTPDLILMDIQLPGMDGLSATRQIKTDENIKDTPVIALTAYAMKGDEQKVLEAGCAGYMTKPLDTKCFLKDLKAYLPKGEDGGERQQAFTGRKTDQEIKVTHEDRFYSNKILIVDDDPLNVKLLKAKLSMDTFLTIEAYNGHECLKKVKEEHPDLILLDLMMPGISGFEVTRILKKDNKTKDIPIIHVTALDSNDDKARALEAGADEFLNKPINTKELLTRIRSLLKLKKYQEQLSTRKKSESYFLLSESPSPELEDISLKVNILVADTNKKDVDFIKKNISDYSNKLLVTGCGKEAVQIVESEQIDLVIMDIPLANMDGYV
ncbi:MAG: response regulator [Desulfobacterium sp.]|nr:response regulator [Desulfobacterium sp.]